MQLLSILLVVLSSKLRSFSMNHRNSGDIAELSKGIDGSLSSYSIHTPATTVKDWHKFCPPKNKKTVADVSVSWIPSSNAKSEAQEAAKKLLHKMDPTIPDDDDVLVRALSSYLLEFSGFCDKHLEPYTQLKATMVASRGSSGTQCPLWHVDNVPVRWIQALVGPGCDLVTSQQGVNWTAASGWDNCSCSTVEGKNQHRVNPEIATTYSALEQEVALLLGGRWNQCCKKPLAKEQLPPVAHKSPSPIPAWQGRLLLKQDVIMS